MIVVGIIILVLIIACLIKIGIEEKANKRAKFEQSQIDEQYTMAMQKLINMHELNQSQYRLGLSSKEEYEAQGKMLAKMGKEIKEEYGK